MRVPGLDLLECAGFSLLAHVAGTEKARYSSLNLSSSKVFERPRRTVPSQLLLEAREAIDYSSAAQSGTASPPRPCPFQRFDGDALRSKQEL